jgi:hypothetical protein
LTNDSHAAYLLFDECREAPKRSTRILAREESSIRPLVAFAAAISLCAAITAASAADLTPAPAPSATQTPYFLGQPLVPGWSFSVTPYGWLTSVSSKVNTPIPGGGTATTDVSVPFSELLSDLRFGVMLAAEARYDRFSLLSDFIYANVGMNAGAAKLTSINLGPEGRINIPVGLEANAGTGMGMTIWTLAGGYTLLEGPWGHLDVIAGTRFLGIDVISNYNLNAAIFLPRRTIPFARSGTLTANVGYWDAIGGVTGRFDIPNSKFFLPYYFDAGGGGMPFTWQAFGGVGYHAAAWADLSLVYRYLDFQNNSSAHVQSLAMGGPIFVATFRF